MICGSTEFPAFFRRVIWHKGRKPPSEQAVEKLGKPYCRCMGISGPGYSKSISTPQLLNYLNHFNYLNLLHLHHHLTPLIALLRDTSNLPAQT
jgi:hypothetical protein